MKIHVKDILPVLLASLGLISAGRVTAQTFTTLHNFAATFPWYINSNYYTNNDGANPAGSLILSGETLYGTATQGGSSGEGTVFAMHTNGSGFTNLHSFTPYGNPWAGLILSNNALYGTGGGTVFALNTDGTGFTNLHIFAGNDGGRVVASVVLSGKALYGTAADGGSSGNGVVFAVNTDGTGFTNLHSFTALYTNSSANGDGANPYGGLVLSGSTLYGTTSAAGAEVGGTVFALNTDGSGFTNLHSFSIFGGQTNAGAFPHAGLILAGNILYGTTYQGGGTDSGTVFAINTNGTGFTTLHSFTGSGSPACSLILSGKTLYGTTTDANSFVGGGAVFAVNTDGTGFTNLYYFGLLLTDVTNADGTVPVGGLTLSLNTLYGSAQYGGSSGNGTMFSLSFAPQLTIIPSGTNVMLTWPTNVAGFDYSGYTLQSTTNLVSPAVWATASPGPVVINGQNTVTNPITGVQQFYRLKQ
jgi:uncharacterized repeat protein (TIGR03803 family)